MSFLHLLDERDLRLVWALEIGGLPLRYVSGPGLDAKALPNTAGNYSDIIALQGITAASGELPTVGGRAESGPVHVTIASRTDGERPEMDPFFVFDRVGPRDTTWARLIVDVEHAELGVPAAIAIDRDPAIFGSYPRIIYIGREAIRVTGSGGTGTDIDPYTLTTGTRAVYGSAPEGHQGAQAAEAVRPYVTADLIGWEGQRAILYVGQRLDDGSVTLGEYMRGALEGPPKRSPDGLSWSVSVVPMAALLDKPLAPQVRAVGLLQGWHYFEGSGPCIVQVAQRWPQGAAIRIPATANRAAGIGTVAANTDVFNNNFDLSLPDGHPRHGRLRVLSQGNDEDVVPSAAAAGSYTVGANQPAGAIAIGDIIENADLIEIKRVELCTPEPGQTALLAWPHDAVDLFNATMTPGDYTGDTGAWLDTRLFQDGEGWALRCEYNTAAFKTGAFIYALSSYDGWPSDFGDPGRYWNSDGEPEGIVGNRSLFWAGLDFAAPDDTRWPAAWGLPREERLARGQIWTREINMNRAQRTARIRGVPTALYQTGEKYILAGGPVTVPSGAIAWTYVRIEYFDLGLGREETAYIRIVGSTAVGDGYALEVHQDDRDIAPTLIDAPGLPKVKLEPVIYTQPRSSGLAMLELLYSGQGNGVNHALDVHFTGLNRRDGDVDDASFTRFVDPPNFDRWRLLVRPNETPNDALDAMLVCTGTAIVQDRTIDGRCRLRRVSVGPESVLEARGTIGAGLWLTGSESTDTDTKVWNVHKLRIDYEGDGTGRKKDEITLNDFASLAVMGKGEELALEARGLELDPLDAAEAEDLARDLLGRLSVLAGFPRRVWEGRVGLGTAILAELGAVYLVSSNHLADFKARRPGVSGVAARLVKIETDAWQGTARLKFRRHGARLTGVNMAAWITSATSSTEVVVTTQVFSPLEHPTTGVAMVDLTSFAVADQVQLFNAADRDGHITRTIGTIDLGASKVTFTAAHGWAGPYPQTVNARMKPAAYDLASVLAKALGFLGDAAGGLGATPDPAPEWE